MFVYCNNEPIIGIDPQGLWTISFSVSANITVIVGLSVGIGVSFDDDGNIALQWSYSIPEEQTGSVGLVDAGVAGSIHVNRADTVDDLEGVGSAVGTSIGAGWYGGIDVTSNTYIADHDAEIDGVQLSAGYGVGLDVHVNQTKTVTLKKTTWSKIADKIRRWFL